MVEEKLKDSFRAIILMSLLELPQLKGPNKRGGAFALAFFLAENSLNGSRILESQPEVPKLSYFNVPLF